MFLETKGSIGSYPVPDPEDPPRPDSNPEQIQFKVRSGIHVEDDICSHLLNLPDSPLEPEPEESIESDFSVPSHSTIIDNIWGLFYMLCVFLIISCITYLTFIT